MDAKAVFDRLEVLVEAEADREILVFLARLTLNLHHGEVSEIEPAGLAYAMLGAMGSFPHRQHVPKIKAALPRILDAFGRSPNPQVTAFAEETKHYLDQVLRVQETFAWPIKSPRH